uniref:Uncharacterized protein n=1 Tax=Takifugu rubripes TaxID=31033 RepID=A0A674PE76_TAKRU
ALCNKLLHFEKIITKCTCTCKHILSPFRKRFYKKTLLQTNIFHASLDEEVTGDSSKKETEVFGNPDIVSNLTTVKTHEKKPDQHTIMDPEPSVTRGVGPILESHPCVPVQSTLVGPPSVAVMVNEASGDQKRPTVDPKSQCDDKDEEEVRVEIPTLPPGPDTGSIPTPPPEPDTVPPGPDTGSLPTLPPGPDTGSLPTPPPEPDTGSRPTLPPGPDTGSLTTPPPGPDTGSIPTPPPEPDTGSRPTLPPGPDTGSLTTPPPGPDTGSIPTPPPEPDTGSIPTPPPEPDTGSRPTLPPGPDTGSLTTVPPGPDTGSIPTPPPEPDTGSRPTLPPGPDTGSLTTVPPGPDTGSIPTPPPEPDTGSLPTLPPGPDTGSRPTLPPGPDTGSLPTVPPGPDTGSIPTPPPEPDTGSLPTPPPEPDTGSRPTLPPGPDTGSLTTVPPGPDTGSLPTLPPGPDTGSLPTLPPGPDTGSLDTDVRTSGSQNVKNLIKLYGQEHRPGSTKSDWQDNAALKRPWLPDNSHVCKIPNLRKNLISAQDAPEDLPPGLDTGSPDRTSSQNVKNLIKLYSQEHRPGSTKSDWQDNAALKCPWLPDNSRVCKILNLWKNLISAEDAPEDLPPGPDTGSPDPDFKTLSQNVKNLIKLYGQEYRPGSTKSDWQDNAALKCQNVISAQDAPEDLGTP